MADKRPLIKGFHGVQPYSRAEVDAMPWDHATHIGWSLPASSIGFDVDHGMRNGVFKAGRSDLEFLEEELGVLPQSFRQTTGSGGLHIVMWCKPFKKLPKRLWDSAGNLTDIDIALPLKLYLVLYEPERLLDAVFEELPYTWDKCLRNRPAGFLHDISEAPFGERNTTLNATAFQLAKVEGPSEGLRQKLTDAARSSGLEPREIASTINSAFNAADKARQPFLAWLQAVQEDPHIAGKQNKLRIYMTTQQFVDVCLRTAKTVIGMSGRQLAERISCQQPAAANAIKVLVEAGYLQPYKRTDRTSAKEYRLVLEKCNSQLTHPRGEERVSRQLQVPLDRLSEILNHDVFRRSKDGGWLPETVGVVLAYMEHVRRCPRRGLAGKLGRSPKAVRDALKILGLRVLQKDGELVMWQSVEAILDSFASNIGAHGRRERLVEVHAKQRQQRLEFLQMKDGI